MSAVDTGRAAPTIGRMVNRLTDALDRPLVGDAIGEHLQATELEHLLLAGLLDPAEEVELLRRIDRQLVERCRDLFRRHETSLEISVARLVAGSQEARATAGESIALDYLLRYRRLAAREVALASIRPSDRVVFLGSGPLPITAIEYVRQVGCMVCCVDFVPAAIESSSEIARDLHIEARLTSVCARAEEFDVAGYDVALVAVLAEPKAAILASLDRHAPPDARLLCRTTHGLRQMIYPPTPSIPLRRFREVAASRARGDDVLSTQLWSRCP